MRFEDSEEGRVVGFVDVVHVPQPGSADLRGDGMQSEPLR
jgi:hypothetical protein